MSRLIIFNLVTLDGFFEGPANEIDWHNVDAAFNDFAIKQLKEVGALIFGRKTYDLMFSYWPTQEAIANDPVVAGLMNSLPKIVFSKTMNEAAWNNTTLVKTDPAEAIKKLKEQQGKDIFIFGSADLSAKLINAGLIDEFRIMINPVLLGSGKSLFRDIKNRIKLELLEAKVFESGNVLLYYKPV